MSDVQVNYFELSAIANAVSSINSRVSQVSNQVMTTQQQLNKALADLEDIKHRFVTLMDEQKKSAALQRAITEIVRIRQELDKNFGNQQEVRKHMLGILQASDLSLVKEKTIAECSEQLMIACPKYWLAPCLIAITAWMANDRVLAERALKEALSRNDENTSLVLALVCRRADRMQASFQWLQRYFNMQNANNMKESILALIDAYANGVFGEDKNNICSESVESWMYSLEEEIPNFRDNQEEDWKRKFDAIKEKRLSGVNTLSIDGVCSEYGKIYDYVSRIRNKDKINQLFSIIMSKHVDKKQLIQQIDENLETLVSRYEEDEAPLRYEERRMSLIKEYNGDEERAEAVLNAERSPLDGNVNLAERLSNAIVDANTKWSVKKTSVVLMQSFIKQAYKEYMTEKAADFPKEITINVGGMALKTADGTNKENIKQRVMDVNNQMKSGEISKIKNTGAIVCGVVSGIALIICVLCLVLGKGTATAIGVIAGVAAFISFIMIFATISTNKKKRAAIELRYADLLNSEIIQIDYAISEWVKLREEVIAFENMPDRDVLLIPASDEVRI